MKWPLVICLFFQAERSFSYTLFANLLYESDDLVAPALLFHSDPYQENIYDFSIIGRSLSFAAERKYTPDFSLGSSVGWSPKFANGSDRIYDDELKRQKHLSYSDREIRGDMFAVKSMENWSLKGGIQTQYHKIEDLPDGTSGDERMNKWKKPYFGLLGVVRYRSTIAEDRYKDRIDGQKAYIDVDSFFVPHAWNRGSFGYSQGSFLGTFYLSQELKFFQGTGLDMISRHIVGGSWDFSDDHKVYGSRAYQHRLEKGGLANLRCDYMLAHEFDVSLQLGMVAYDERRFVGGVLKIFKTYQGILYEFGAAHQRTVSHEIFFDQFIFARVSLALLSYYER